MRAVSLSVALILLPALALAAADNGFGLAGGIVGNQVNPVLGQEHRSVGLNLTGDAQFVLTDDWSLDPFLMLSLEQISGEFGGSASNGVAGLGLRRWFGDVFIGAHLAYYVELVATKGTTSTQYGPGVGAEIGAEWDDGWTWALMLDRPRILPLGDLRVALRLQVGKRWR